MPCISACSVITIAGVLETDQWTYYGMLFKIKGKKENLVKEKKKALNKEDK
jgi:hypothetical protein